MIKDLFDPMNHPLDQCRPMRFDGHAYEKKKDQARLTGQIKRVFTLMQDGCFRTLDEISRITGDPAASVSAQLRNLRKEKFGAHRVDRRARGDRENGLFEYSLRVNGSFDISRATS